MFDPETLAQAVSAGVGATICVSLGGKLDPDHAGLPVMDPAAMVVAITDGKYNASPGSVGAGSSVRCCSPDQNVVFQGAEVVPSCKFAAHATVLA